MTTRRAVHPGEILREEFLAPLELSARALAIALEVPASRVNEVVRERRDLTSDIAQRLACYFDTTLQFWTDLQASYDLKLGLKRHESDVATQDWRKPANCGQSQ